MILFFKLNKLSNYFETDVDGSRIKITYYYSQVADRWIMDVENKRLDRKIEGVVMNVGVDLLATAGFLGLQALVLISFPEPRKEASFENFSESVRFAYMDLETYNDILLDGEVSRVQWIIPTPNKPKYRNQVRVV